MLYAQSINQYGHIRAIREGEEKEETKEKKWGGVGWGEGGWGWGRCGWELKTVLSTLMCLDLGLER